MKKNKNKNQFNAGEILLYQTEDGGTRVDVRLQDETVWLSLNQLAELFQRHKSVISKHIKNIFEDGELEQKTTVAKFATVQKEGDVEKSRDIEFYNLDVIISVGYRVKSHRGTQFRIWATQQLKEYLIKGFILDDERFKQNPKDGYFDELLSRIRDIRSSEKEFWRKVLAIYATSIDYSPNSEISQEFFKIVQNKMHWAAHGHTAAEIISARVDAKKPNIGLTTWKKGRVSPSRSDIEIAKNYLTYDELDILNRIVTMYLEYAELQAKKRQVMYMKDWIKKLDEFLKFNEQEVLSHSGKITHESAVKKAYEEYDKFLTLTVEEPSLVEKHFFEVVEKLEA